MGWPNLIGICNANKHGVGDIVIGDLQAIPPVVYCLEWPQMVQLDIISETNPDGTITNSDLECVGLLLVWLVMEATVPDLLHTKIAL